MRSVFLLFLVISLHRVYSKESDDEFLQKCKSCITVLDEFRSKFPEVLKDGKIGSIKEEATKVCSEYKENSPEYKFCYEIGAIEQSSQSLMLQVSQGLSYQDGTKKCKALKPQYPDLCRDKYKIKIDWDNGFNPAKLSIKRLKAILTSYKVPTKGFTEKVDYVKAVEDQILTTLYWKEPSAIITVPTPLCFDIAVYVSHTLLANDESYNRTRNNIGEILVNAQKVYAWHRIELRVKRVVFFNESDPFEITDNYDQIMEAFTQYVINTTEKADASVLLIDKETTEKEVVGRAYLGMACTDFGIAIIQGGVIQLHDPRTIGRTLAHELGHILNMEHAVDGVNDCRCALHNDTCIMGFKLFQWTPILNSPPFHSCSIKEVLAENYDCLKKCSPLNSKFDICGDGVINREESPLACDCGTKETCDIRNATECCDFTQCKLRPHARCSEEACCTNCQFTPGKVCRRNEGECGISEICQNTSAECPKDLHVYNGKPCGQQGYCFDGTCTDKDQVCQNMFKKSTNVRYSTKCSNIMEAYNQNDYCNEATVVEDDRLARNLICYSAMDPCSYVWCEMDQPKDPFYAVLTFNITNENVHCYTIDNPKHFAPNGYLCGVDKICYKGDCKPLTEHKTSCPICPKGMVCSNLGTCALDY